MNNSIKQPIKINTWNKKIKTEQSHTFLTGALPKFYEFFHDI